MEYAKCKEWLKRNIHETKSLHIGGKDEKCIPKLEEAFNRGVSNKDQERDWLLKNTQVIVM